MKQKKVDKLNSGNKTEMVAAKKEADEKQKRDLQAQREKEMEEFKVKNAKAHKTVVYA